MIIVQLIRYHVDEEKNILINLATWMHMSVHVLNISLLGYTCTLCTCTLCTYTLSTCTI